jgi:SAM-dependent methyltransferase
MTVRAKRSLNNRNYIPRETHIAMHQKDATSFIYSDMESQPEPPWASVGSRSSDNVAIVGHSNFIFLLEGSNRYYEAYSQAGKEAYQEALDWSRYLDWARTSCARANISFSFCLIPNKASVLPDLYPLPLPPGGTPRMQHLLDLQRSHIVGGPVPKECRWPRTALFRRNDTHLTALGSFYFVDALMEHLGYSESVMHSNHAVGKAVHPGDLGRRFVPPMLEAATTPARNSNITESIVAQSPSSFVGLTTDIVNPDPVLQKTVVVFGNSFFERFHSWGMMPIFARYFRRVVFKWNNELDFPLINQLKPDHVVLQTCERFLGKPPKPNAEIIMKNPVSMKSTAADASTNQRELSCISLKASQSGTLELTGKLGEPASLYAGEHFLGHITDTSLQMPWRDVALHSDSVSLFGVSLLSDNKKFLGSLDVTAFVSHYLGYQGLLEKLRHMIGPGKWVVYSIGVSGQTVRATLGFVMSLPSRTNVGVRIYCNGIEAKTSHISKDHFFSSSHWFMPENCVFRIDCLFEVPLKTDFLRFTVSFDDCVPDDIARHYRPAYTACNLSLLNSLPDINRIKRVAGSSANQIGFLNGGYTAFQRLRDLFQTHRRPSRTTLNNVLDWGVGCGRVALHFSQQPDVKLSGVDIDADNIEWCKTHLLGEYNTVALMPPAECLPTETFDLIYSCSVLSHLTEETTNAWLGEMARVLKPDGLALLSFNGSSNLASYLAKRPDKLREALRKGFFDGDNNHDLKGFIPSDSYYRATFATDQWWSEAFNKHFRLTAVERAVVSGYQDIAVLRKK